MSNTTDAKRLDSSTYGMFASGPHPTLITREADGSRKAEAPPRAVRMPRSFNAAAMARATSNTGRLYLAHDGQHVGGEGVGRLSVSR